MFVSILFFSLNIDAQTDTTHSDTTANGAIHSKSSKEVYDKYEVKIEGVTDYSSSFLCGNKLTDEGSFVVQINANDGNVTDIQNHMMKIPVRMTNCPCTITWLNEETCLGPIHITGIKNIKVTPPDPPSQPYSFVQIEFIPATAVYPSIANKCKGKSMTIPPTFGPAVPIYIEFYTKNESQTLIPFKTPNTEFKITVRPLRKD